MLKRPVAVFGLVYLAASAAAVCLTSAVNATVAVMVMLTGCTACLFTAEKRRAILLVSLALFLGFFRIGMEQEKVESLSRTLGTQTCQIAGEITDMPVHRYGRWYYVIRADRIDIPDAGSSVRMRLSSPQSLEEAKEGDRVVCTVSFMQNMQNRHTPGYDSETSLCADGIMASAWRASYMEYTVIPGKSGIRYAPVALRRHILAAIRRALPSRTASLLCAMLLGNTDSLAEETVADFRAVGLSHLIAVSGLHVSLLAYAAWALLKRLRPIPVPVCQCILMGCILLFMAVTGFSPSVTRAGVMTLMAIVAKMSVREFDPITAISVSVLVLCLVNPWCAADIGLQLSVCASLGLVLGGQQMTQAIRRHIPPFEKGSFRNRLRAYGTASLGTSLTASLATFPLCALYFGQVSLIAPLANLLCIWAASLFLNMGILASLLYAIPFCGWLLSLPFRMGAGIAGLYLESVAAGLSRLPLAAVQTRKPYMPLFFFFAGLILAAAYLIARRQDGEVFHRLAVRSAFCWIAVLLFVSMLSHQVTCVYPSVTVFSTQNNGVCVCAQNRGHALIAETNGEPYDLLQIRNRLADDGVRSVNAIAASSTDGRGRLAALLIREYRPDYLVCSQKEEDMVFAKKAAAKAGTEIRAFGATAALPSCGLSLRTFRDIRGGLWEKLQCGDAYVLVCPEAGDCALLPPDLLTNDVIVIGDDIKNIFRLSAAAVIVTAPEEKAALTVSRLRVKGFSEVILADHEGGVTFTVRNGKLCWEYAQP